MDENDNVNNNSTPAISFDFANVKNNDKYLPFLKSELNDYNFFFIMRIITYAIMVDNVNVFKYLEENKLISKKMYKDKNYKRTLSENSCPQIEKYLLEKTIKIPQSIKKTIKL